MSSRGPPPPYTETPESMCRSCSVNHGRTRQQPPIQLLDISTLEPSPSNVAQRGILTNYLPPYPFTQPLYQYGQSPYPSIRSPYPSNQPPFPSTQSPYQFTRSPHPYNQPPYPSTRSPNLLTRSPYPSTQSPNQFTRSLHPSNQSPYPSYRSPYPPNPSTHPSDQSPNQFTQATRYEQLNTQMDNVRQQAQNNANHSSGATVLESTACISPLPSDGYSLIPTPQSPVTKAPKCEQPKASVDNVRQDTENNASRDQMRQDNERNESRDSGATVTDPVVVSPSPSDGYSLIPTLPEESTMPTTDYMAWSVFSTVFCCFCIGIFAIMGSRRAHVARANNNIALAKKSARQAWTLNVIACVLGAVLVWLSIIAFICYYVVKDYV